jgi:glycosyltransferase involved in cell wall biosynthesis
MPKVSIIIPVYNKSSYIANTLESVLHQTFSDYEVVAVNDGSTDGSLEILNEYANKDARFHIIDIPNGGVSNARNVGLSHASGDWIQFLDGDDLIDQDYLKEAVKKAEETKADIVFTDFWMVNTVGEKQKNIKVLEQGITDQAGLCRCFMEYQYRNGYFGYPSNKLVSKNLLRTSNAKFQTNIKLAEDLDFYANLYRSAKQVCFMPIISYYYLQTDENYLNNTEIDYISQLNVQLDIREWFVQSGLYNEYKNILDKKVSDYVYFSIFYTYEENKDLESVYQLMISDELVMSCICFESYSGFERCVLQAVKEKEYRRLCILLKRRYSIRTIYRRIKRNG